MRNPVWTKAYALVALATAVFMLGPIVMVLFSGVDVNVEIWRRLWVQRIPMLVVNTLSLVGVVSVGSVVLGGGLAWLVERTDVPGRNALRPMLITPLIIPCYITAICYVGFFGVRGLAEQMLAPFFPNIRMPSIYGFGGAAVMLTIGAYPYVYTIVRSSIRRLDPTLFEAACCLGVGRWQRFWRVGIPILAPALTAGGSLAMLYALSDFGVVRMLRYQTFVNAIYEQISGRFDYSTASALSLVLIALTFCVLFLQEHFGSRRRYYTGSPREGHWPVVCLGVWRWPAACCAWVVVAVGWLIPTGILIYWFIQSLRPQGYAEVWQSSAADVLWSTWHSFYVSAGASTLAVALAVPLAYWVVRRPHSLGRITAWLAQTGVALPGVLIALGISLVCLATMPRWNYSVLAMIAAYLIHFFAQTFQSVRSGFTQVPASLEESARILGCPAVHVFFTVTRPLLQSSLWTGWILMFLSCIRELPASLLLRPAGFDTLTVKVWIAASEGFYAQAAGPALMLVVLSLPLIFLIFHYQKETQIPETTG